MKQELKQTRIDTQRAVNILKDTIKSLNPEDAIVLQRTLDKIADSESFADSFRGLLRDDKLKSISYNEKLSLLDASKDFSYESAGLTLEFLFADGVYEMNDGSEVLMENLTKHEVARILRDLSQVSIISIGRFQNDLSKEITLVTKLLKKVVLGNGTRYERLFHGIDKVLEFRIIAEPEDHATQAIMDQVKEIKFFRNQDFYPDHKNLVVFYDLTSK